MSEATLHFRPFGSSLTLETASAEVIAAAREGLGRYPEDLEIGGALTITAGVHAGGSDDPGWPTVAADLDAERLMIRCGSSQAIVRFGAGAADISFAASMLPIADGVRLFLEAVFTSIHVHHARLVAVHSALVSRDGVGVMLRGPSGAGKSTLAYSCLRRGMSITSDDWLYAAAKRPAGWFAGYPWRMLLTDEAAARFPELADHASVPHTSAEGHKVAISPPDSQRVELQDVRAVVIVDPDGPLALRAVSATEAIERFWAAALPTEREHISTEWVRGLLTDRTYVLGRGASPDDAAAVLDDLAVSLR